MYKGHLMHTNTGNPPCLQKTLSRLQSEEIYIQVAIKCLWGGHYGVRFPTQEALIYLLSSSFTVMKQQK